MDKMTKIAKGFSTGRDPQSLVVVVPSDFRRELGVEPGDYFRVSIKHGEIAYKPINFEDLEGARKNDETG